MDTYRSGAGGGVSHLVSGPSLPGGLGYQLVHELAASARYPSASPLWEPSGAGDLPLAFAVLADCLGEESAADQAAGLADHLHEQFAADVLANRDHKEMLDLQWEDVLRWLDGRLNEGNAGALTRLCEGVHRFETRLLAAAAVGPYDERRRYVDPDIWVQWNLDDLLHTVIARRTFALENLPRLMGCLMDIKFKMYCLLECDLPAYSIAIEHYGLDTTDPAATPHGLAIRLSSEATAIVKVRSIWESVMNLVFAAEGVKRPPAIRGVDSDGFSFGSKTKFFFKYVVDRPLWSGLSGFRPLIESLDDDRTPEIHMLSQLRGDFVEGKYRPLSRITSPLNQMLFYVWDHLSSVVFFEVGPTYDVALGTGVHIDLTGPPRGGVR